MMGLKRLIIVMATGSIMITGCQWAHKVSVTQSVEVAPKFVLFAPLSGWLQPEKIGVGINQLVVMHKQKNASGRHYAQIWLIRTKSGEPIMVKEVVYGVVPPGFEETISARALIAGEIYEIMSSKQGDVGGGGFQAAKDWPANGDN